MKVECVSTDGGCLTEDQYKAGYMKTTQFRLERRMNYHVLAISVWKGQINYLVIDIDKIPNWYPAQCFKIIDNKIPEKWKFGVVDDPDSYLSALLGYTEMVEDETHYEALLDRDPNLIHFVRRLAIEMENEEKERTNTELD